MKIFGKTSTSNEYIEMIEIDVHTTIYWKYKGDYLYVIDDMLFGTDIKMFYIIKKFLSSKF